MDNQHSLRGMGSSAQRSLSGKVPGRFKRRDYAETGPGSNRPKLGDRLADGGNSGTEERKIPDKPPWQEKAVSSAKVLEVDSATSKCAKDSCTWQLRAILSEDWQHAAVMGKPHKSRCTFEIEYGLLMVNRYFIENHRDESGRRAPGMREILSMSRELTCSGCWPATSRRGVSRTGEAESRPGVQPLNLRRPSCSWWLPWPRPGFSCLF